MKIRLVIYSSAQIGASVDVSLDGYSSTIADYLPTFGGPLVTYHPSNLNTTLTAESCCVGMRGNLDSDPEDIVDIEDLVFFIDYAFTYPPEVRPACFREADVDGSGVLDIVDIVYLVDYMFKNPQGPEPVSCF